MMAYDDKIMQLERTILELGTEIFRIKNEMGSLRDFNENFREIMKGLKHILDDKGLIAVDDFENAVELGKAIAGGSPPVGYDPGIEEELDRIKKTSH